jgi:hypothetical protein
MRIVTADASRVSGADFLKHVLGERRPSELHRLCEDLMRAAIDGDTAKCRTLRAEIKALKRADAPPELKRTGTGGYWA